jgi:hypothetical protein
MTTKIAIAAKNCRAAWTAAPNAKAAWCLHHGRELERLTEPAEKRIAYILAYKPQSEQVARLNNFRPVLSRLPEALEQIMAAFDKVWAAYHKAWTACDKAEAACDKARAACDKARAARDKARAACDKALAACDKEKIARLHIQDVPNHTWNGTDIF